MHAQYMSKHKNVVPVIYMIKIYILLLNIHLCLSDEPSGCIIQSGTK